MLANADRVYEAIHIPTPMSAKLQNQRVGENNAINDFRPKNNDEWLHNFPRISFNQLDERDRIIVVIGYGFVE